VNLAIRPRISGGKSVRITVILVLGRKGKRKKKGGEEKGKEGRREWVGGMVWKVV